MLEFMIVANGFLFLFVFIFYLKFIDSKKQIERRLESTRNEIELIEPASIMYEIEVLKNQLAKYESHLKNTQLPIENTRNKNYIRRNEVA